MSDAVPTPDPDTLARAARIDELCDRYEAACRAGERPEVGAFLRSAGVEPGTAHPDLLRELARVEAAYSDSPPDETAALSSGAPPGGSAAGHPEQAGTVLAGRYKLVEPIGEGGMGSVWLARQTEPVKRLVAVKLIKAGMDSKAVLARFEAERQALALMDHPNIAKVLDAGATAEGRPFFVMELVKGVPITKYCDEHRLTPRRRLELFVPVCRAIQHAHQKGVIHRDIKPNNVLVALYDDKPVPKVIDFGVAKATGQPLTEQTLATGLNAVVGTPEYMSPEQASLNNLDIDTRSDVYSLGVLLYELLAGSPPFPRRELAKAGLMEILRVIREQEPPRPSTKLSTAAGLAALASKRGTEPGRLAALVRGELDWIVMKALEKDRTRRYETANGFAADVERYLAGDPVLAVPPSAGYRLRKFLRRHRARVAVATVLLATVLAGAATATVFAIRAESERAQKEEEQKQTAQERDNVREEQKQTAQERDNVKEEQKKTAQERDNVRKQRDRARGLLYDSLASGAGVAAAEYRGRRMRELLDDARPGPGEDDLRGWEWHYLDRLHRGTAVVHRLADDPRVMDAASVAMSADGRRFAFIGGGPSEIIPVQDIAIGGLFNVITMTAAHTLEVRDVASGEVVWTIPGKWRGRVETPNGRDAVLLSPDGRFLAAWEFDLNPPEVLFWGPCKVLFMTDPPLVGPRLRLFDIDARRELATPGIPRGLLPVHVGPGGQFLVYRSSGQKLDAKGRPVRVLPTVSRWDRESGEVTARVIRPARGPNPERRVIHPESVSPDGRLAVARTTEAGDSATPGTPEYAGPEYLDVWNLTPDPPEHLWTARRTDKMWDPRFSPDGTRLVVGAGTDLMVVFDSRTGKVEVEYLMPRFPYAAVGLTPADDTPTLSDGNRRLLLRGPEGTLFAAEPIGDRPGLSGWRTVPLLGHTGRVRRMLLTPDGRRAVTVGGGDATLRSWDLDEATGYAARWTGEKKVYSFGKFLVALDANPNGLNNRPLGLDAATGKEVEGFEVKGLKPGGIQSFTRDGRRVLVTNPPIADGPPWWVLLKPEDGSQVATGTRTNALLDERSGRWVFEFPADLRGKLAGSLVIRSAETGEVVARSQLSAEHWVRFRWMGLTTSPAGDRLAWLTARPTGPYTLRVLEPSTARELGSHSLPPENREERLATSAHPDVLPVFAPDGRTLTVAWAGEGGRGGVRVLSADTAAVLRDLPVRHHPRDVAHRISYGSNGRLAVSFGREVLVWGGEGVEPVYRLRGHEGRVTDIVFSPDGTRLFTLDHPYQDGRMVVGTNTLRVWNLTTGREVLVVPRPDHAVWSSTPSVGGGYSTGSLWLSGSRLFMTTPTGIRVFDGTPMPD